MVSVQSNDQRLLERILEDQHRKLAPDKNRDDFFTFFAADKALQDWDLDNDEITDGIVDGAHDCGIDGIWTFVDERYITADAHQFLPSRAGKIELVILQAKNSSGYQESVIEKLHFHLPALLDMGRDEEDLVAHTNAKLLERTRRFLISSKNWHPPSRKFASRSSMRTSRQRHRTPTSRPRATGSDVSWRRSHPTPGPTWNTSTPLTCASGLPAEPKPSHSWCSPKPR
ncbi:hypothetical protein [Streptomyces olivaceus]|uniref:hypothetical protein n=1 Tax=Streptomyces olivaceus TaxID=47716 RepID=UPI001CCFC0D6|nr:hypothetical protein [Streptomyces olivaceus]